MNEIFLSCTRSTLRLNSPCEIRRQPSQARPISLKIFIFSFMLREDTMAKSTNVKEKLQEDRSSMWFSLSETASKTKTSKNSYLLKEWVYILTRGIKISSNKATCVFISSLRYVLLFVLWICTDKSAFELFSFSCTLNLIWVDQKMADHPYFTRSKGPAFPSLNKAKTK